MIFQCEVIWNEAPESKTQSSSGLSTARSNASWIFSVTALAESSSFFFLGLLHWFLKWPIFPQFQHCTCCPDLDLPLFRLEFLDFDLPRFEFLSLPLPLVSRFRAKPDLEVSPASLLWISLARIKSHMSLYFSFSFLVKLLTAILIAYQLFGKEAKTIRAQISSLKSISTGDNWLVIVLNSFRCCATEAFSAIFKLNNFFIRCTLLFADGFSYILDKAFIRFAVVFSFTTLCATNLDRVNPITPSTCLSRRAYSSAFIASGFVPKRGKCNFLP